MVSVLYDEDYVETVLPILTNHIEMHFLSVFQRLCGEAVVLGEKGLACINRH